jgi:zinc protease
VLSGRVAAVATGVLFNSVRSQAGLAYSVSASWDVPFTHPGLFVAYAETAKPVETIFAIQAVFSDILAKPLPQDVVEQKKQELVNSFVFQYASKTAQLRRAALLDLLGLPKVYDQQYQAGLQRVTAESAYAATKLHLHPDRQIIVVVGDAAKVKPSLERLGLLIKTLEM